MTAPEPIATGTLAKTPLPHLLVYLEQKKLSGTLAVWTDTKDEGEHKKHDRILLLKGTPVAGRMLEPATTLREGMLRLFARTRAPYAFYETNLLGDDRISGRVDPFSLIAESLRSAARDDVVEQVLGRFDDARLRIAPGVDLKRYELLPEERALVELLQAEPAPVAALVQGSGLPEVRARRLVYLLAITKALAPYDESAPRERVRIPEPADDGDEPESAGETAEAAEANAPASSTPASPAPSAPASPPPSAPASPAASANGPDGAMHGHLERLHEIPGPPQGLSDELRERWMRVVAKGRLIENQNYFEMLDLDKEAKSTDARTKYYQLAKEWHPDRLPPELEPVREYVQIIFSYLSEASQVLGDEPQRVKYVQTVREGGGTPATDRLMQAILDTAMEYERVLVLQRKHAYDEAIDVLRKIMARVKDEPDYHATYAWLLMQKFPGPEAPLPKMLDSVNKALELHDRHERANMLKGQILRRMGRQDEALKFFRIVAEINPRNIEAVREVRVATMRTSKPPAGSKGGVTRGAPGKSKGKGKKDQDDGGVGGLLGKLFKRD